MELDSKGLGRLRRVSNPREVWPGEASDFTPWLAANLDVLGEELGLALTLVATEVPVGEFRLDIRAETHDGRVVVIENQLDRTDHGHLGQLLVYASGLEAAAVVWVAPKFRDEFRRTLDWLNERTDSGVDFFGVEVGLVQISGLGPPAPVFEVVARPNAWQKGVKETSPAKKRGVVGPTYLARQEFFRDVLSEVVAVIPSIRMPASQNSNWLNYASGPFGNWCLSVTREGRLQLEAYIDMEDSELNKRLFDAMYSERDHWNKAVGEELSWQRLDQKRASRIALYHPPFDLADDHARSEAKDWAVRAASRMYDQLNTTLRARAAELRQAARAETGGNVEGRPED